jgi:hypothetical protein
MDVMRLRSFISLSGAGAFAAALLLLSPATYPQPMLPGDGEPILHLSSGSVRTEVTAVIEAQLAAFRAGDYRKAHSFAVAEMQQALGVPEFEAMVRGGYPAIAHSRGAAFGLALDAGDEAVITVRVQGAENNSIAYQYHLRKEAAGWRIAAVTELEDKGMVV